MYDVLIFHFFHIISVKCELACRRKIIVLHNMIHTAIDSYHTLQFSSEWGGRIPGDDPFAIVNYLAIIVYAPRVSPVIVLVAPIAGRHPFGIWLRN